jgi:hypothetical protein
MNFISGCKDNGAALSGKTMGKIKNQASLHVIFLWFCLPGDSDGQTYRLSFIVSYLRQMHQPQGQDSDSRSFSVNSYC